MTKRLGISVRHSIMRRAASILLLCGPGLFRSEGQVKLGPNAVRRTAVVATLRDRGFDIKDVAVNVSPFHLVVRNRSGIAKLTFDLDSSSQKQHLVQKDFGVGKQETVESLDLPNGVYTLSVEGHATWVAILRVSR